MPSNQHPMTSGFWFVAALPFAVIFDVWIVFLIWDIASACAEAGCQ